MGVMLANLHHPYYTKGLPPLCDNPALNLCRLSQNVYNFCVSFQKIAPGDTALLQKAYWRKRLYSHVVGKYHNRVGWFCLQYWGDVRRRVAVDSKDSLYLVAKGQGASAVFSLDTYKDIVKNENGFFSF